MPILQSRKGGPETSRPVGLASILGRYCSKIYETTCLSTPVSRSQHGFLEHKTCQTNVVPFFDRVSGLVDEGNGAGIIYIVFGKALVAVLHAYVSWRNVGQNELPLYNWLVSPWQDSTCQRLDVSLAGGVVRSSTVWDLLVLCWAACLMTWLQGWSFLVEFAEVNLGGFTNTWGIGLQFQKVLIGWRTWL